MKLWIAVVLLALSLTLIIGGGCASLWGHSINDEQIYPGTRIYLKAATAPAPTPTTQAQQFSPKINVISGVLVAIDIPLTVILDTILLPIDLANSWPWGKPTTHKYPHISPLPQPATCPGTQPATHHSTTSTSQPALPT